MSWPTPNDRNTVYVLNVPMMKSIDGGKSFEQIRGPHGDHHDLWIRPGDSRVQINGNDGGATVTFDGGATWSTLMNQPTAQMYRVETDNRFPYWIYGGQQDNSTLAIASRSPRGAIGPASQHPVGGGESAHIAFDPNDPRHIYATTINATITEFDTTTGDARSLRPYPEYVFGRDAKDQRYRTNWNAPVEVSPHDPSIIFYGTQILLRSSDRGRSWAEISPDLTRNDPEKQGLGGGPITNEQAGAEFYNTIFSIAPSPHSAETIWVGSDDGLVHVTRDGGTNWVNVTPKDAGEALINGIEVSPHEPAVAYVAVAGYKSNDFTPRIYRTSDYGNRWRKIVDGIPADTFVRAIREDPDRRGPAVCRHRDRYLRLVRRWRPLAALAARSARSTDHRSPDPAAGSDRGDARTWFLGARRSHPTAPARARDDRHRRYLAGATPSAPTRWRRSPDPPGRQEPTEWCRHPLHLEGRAGR